MEILGHSQISLTLGTYSHVVPEMRRDAADKIGDALWGDDSAENDDQGDEGDEGDAANDTNPSA